MCPPEHRPAQGVAVEALPRAVGYRRRHQHLSGSGKAGDTSGEIDGETLDSGMRRIAVRAGPFANLAHVDAGAHAGEVGLFTVRPL